MDAQTVLWMIGQTVIFLGGAYGFVLLRESIVRKEMTEMHKSQDERLAKNEAKAQNIETNYNKKFQNVHDDMHENKSQIINSLHILEINMRESNHALREDISKEYTMISTTDILASYIQRYAVISPKIEGRINFVNR